MNARARKEEKVVTFTDMEQGPQHCDQEAREGGPKSRVTGTVIVRRGHPV